MNPNFWLIRELLALGLVDINLAVNPLVSAKIYALSNYRWWYAKRRNVPKTCSLHCNLKCRVGTKGKQINSFLWRSTRKSVTRQYWPVYALEKNHLILFIILHRQKAHRQLSITQLCLCKSFLSSQAKSDDRCIAGHLNLITINFCLA